MTDDLDGGAPEAFGAVIALSIIVGGTALLIYLVLDILYRVGQFIWTQIEPGVNYLVVVDEIAITVPITADVGLGILFGFFLTLLILHAYSSVRRAISEVRGV